MVEGILIEGLIYGIMVLGVFITFRVLNFADMTVDGSFPLGAAIMAMALIKGLPPAAAMSFAFCGGLAAGFVTALIHTRLKIPDLLSGILTMTMLYSINLRVMNNRANISLLKVPTLFTQVSAWAGSFMPSQLAIVLLCLLVVIMIKLVLDLFFHTDFGLSLGALGANPQLVISQGMNPDVIKICGISLANGLVAISGSFAAMYQGFADVQLGSGMIVSGLASLMIGEFLIRSNKVSSLTLRVLLGSILYRALMYLARNYGYYIHMTANDLKLITGLLIIICIIVSRHGFRAGLPQKNIFKKIDSVSDFIKTEPFKGDTKKSEQVSSEQVPSKQASLQGAGHDSS
ncbi:ABC transporter permease [Spirochaetia bacterium]|nr:ABC transporter permease [Spirochaetia bacterium]